MKYASRILALMVLVAMAGVVRADAPADTSLSGKITKVTHKTITLEDADKKAHKIRTDANTKITLDGKEAALTDLKAGQSVKVTPAKGVAQTIDATSAADAGTTK